MSFATLSGEEEREFARLSRLYWREAIKCESVGAYLAGCTMVGSAVEAILVLMVNCHSEAAERTGKVPHKHKKPRRLVDWGLNDLLRVAIDANWLPAEKFAVHVEAMRKIRNFVHPACYSEDHRRGRITLKMLQMQFEIALACRDWLDYHNNAALLKDMEEHGI